MATSPMRPIRLRILDQEGVANYPNELLSDFDNKKLALYDADHNKMIEFFADLNTEVTGDGNAITELTVSGNKITAVKTETFLTQHPSVSTAVDTTSTASPDFGEVVTIVDSVVRDINGHVIKINLKTLTLPTETELSVDSTGTGNAITNVTVKDHTITMEKNATFLTDHPAITMGTDGSTTETPAHGETFTAIGSVSKDANGHVTAVTTKTIKLPDVSGDVEVEVIGSGNAVTDARADGNKIILGMTKEFLDRHPDVETSDDQTIDDGDWFAINQPFDTLGNIERDEYGHVLHVDTKKIHLKLDVTTSGDGNAVTQLDLDQNTGTINAYKYKTFLEEHPSTTMSTDTTSSVTPAEGGSFEVVDAVTKDAYGHVTKVNTKTVTLPTHEDPVLSLGTATGTGNAVTQLEVSGHTITPVKGATFLTEHPSIDQSEDATVADQKPGYGGMISTIKDIDKDANGHITKVTYQNVYMPDEQTDITGNAGSASKLKTPIAVNISGAVTGSAYNVDGSGNVNIVTTKVDASKIDGVIPIENIPQAALERLIPVTDDAARLSLTADDAQNGDVVKVTNTGLMYYVVDQTKLGTEDAFETFTAGTASAVDWSGITNKPAFAAVATSGSYNDLSDAPGVTVTSEGTGNAVTGVEQNGHGVKITKGATFALSTHTHDAATTSAAGLMGAADKTKLNGIEDGANKTIVDSALDADSTNPVQNKVVKSALDGKANASHTHNYAGSSSAGGAANNVKSSIVVKLNGGTTEDTDMFTFDGSNAKSVNITPIAIGAAAASHSHDDQYYTETEMDAKLAGKSDTTHTHATATTSAAGLMSAADKAKLDSVASDATKVTIDSELSATSTNPVQNKIVKSALDGKSDADHTHNYAGSSSAGGAANKVASSMVVKLNGGIVEDTSMFTFDGSSAKSIDITPSAIGAAVASHSHDDQYYTEAEVDSKLAGKSDTTHTHSAATTTSDGLMSSTDKAKLDTIEEGANKTVVDSTIDADSTNPVQNKVVKSALDTKADSSHTHNYAGSSSAGGAANKVASSIVVKLNGGTTEDTDMFTFDGSTDKSVDITPSTIGAAASSHTHNDLYYTEDEVDSKLAGKSDTTHTHSEASATAAGLMSAADKSKLNAIDDGANKTVVDSALDADSTNPVQNKVINTALAGKSDTAHTHTAADIGAADASHTHDDLYYTEAEMDTMLATKSDTTHTHAAATTSTDGLMSAADKTKLDGLGDMTVDSALSSTSTNPVQNKVVNSAISAKATTILYSTTIPTSGWSGTAAPYTINIGVSGILASDTPIVDVDLSSVDYSAKSDVVGAYSNIYRIQTAADSITVYADEIVSVAVPIQLKVVR